MRKPSFSSYPSKFELWCLVGLCFLFSILFADIWQLCRARETSHLSVAYLRQSWNYWPRRSTSWTKSRKNQLHLQEGLQRSVFPTQVNPPGSTLQSADIGGGALNDIPSKLRQLQLQQRQLQQLQVHSFSKLSLQQLQQLQQMQQLQQLQPQQGQPTAMSQMQHLSQLQMYSSWNQGLMMLPGSPFHALAKKSKAKKPKTPKIVEYPQPDGTWLCSEPDCGKRFQSERSLRSHRIVHVRRKKIQAGYRHIIFQFLSI